MIENRKSQYQLKSFVRRGKRTPAQRDAYQAWGSEFILPQQDNLFDEATIFGRSAPLFVEIGFGTGQSLLAAAKAFGGQHFIGIDVYKSGIGALLMGIKCENIPNLRIYEGDAVHFLKENIPDQYLAGVQVFFPDPWPKRRHHPRRLIQASFVQLIATKLKTGGIFHLATDWEDYAIHMMSVLANESALFNLVGKNQFATRSPYRPVLSKFERRAIKEGRKIWDLQFAKVPTHES